jgi:hypothetical protein
MIINIAGKGLFAGGDGYFLSFSRKLRKKILKIL